MPDSRPWLTPFELILLGAIWGASFMFQRVAAPQFGPIPLVEMRLALGAIPLLPFLWQERARFRGVPLWRIAGIGLINSAIPFMLFAWATERAPAGIGAISNATTAIFAPLLALAVFGEKIHGGAPSASPRVSSVWWCWPVARPQAPACWGQRWPGRLRVSCMR